MILTFCLITVVITCIYYISTKKLDYWKKRGVKYVKPVPFFGNMLPNVIKEVSMPELIMKLYKTFPNERYIGFFQFTTPILFIRDVELVKKITIKNFENFVDHTGFISAEIDPLWGKNLFASKGERWRDLRQTLSPVFTGSKMRAMYILMEDCTKQLISYFKEKNDDIIQIEMKELSERFATDVIATTAFGIKCDSLKNQDNEFLLAGRELTDLSGFNRFKFFLNGNYPTITKLLKIKIVNSKVGNFFKSIITETITLREQKNISRPDFIHLLMLARKGKLTFEEHQDLPEAGFAAVQESKFDKNSKNQFLTNEDITSQAINFFLGGFDTTSSMMSFAAYEIAVNPEIQKKLYKEIQETYQNCNGKLTYEILLGMKYLDMVICEVLRKWTQAIWLDRVCTKPFEIEPERDGEPTLKINKGDICWIPTFAIHHDPNYYENPNVFDPERFSDENKDKIKPNTYLPFGIGPRNCIGSRFALLESKIFFCHLLLNFEIVPTEKTEIPLKIKKDSVLLLPENGFQLGLKKK